METAPDFGKVVHRIWYWRILNRPVNRLPNRPVPMKSEIDPMLESWNSDRSAGLTPEWKPICKINSALPWIVRVNDKTEVKSVYSHSHIVN